MDEKMFAVGKITNTHGIHGEVKVYRLTDFEERFKVGKTLHLVEEDSFTQKLVIKSHRKHKGFDLLSFEGYETINDVENFKNAYLKIKESELTELNEDEYYYYEIIGCDVYTASDEWIGYVKEILAPGANDVFVVNQNNNNKEILIPNIKDIVKKIDVNAKRITIDPMEGLLD